MKATPAQARETWPCPLARTFAEKKGPNCMADHCPIWRWIPLSAKDAQFKAAVQNAIKAIAAEEGKKPSPGLHSRAVERVMEKRGELGLPEGPTHGYCGLAGEPK